MLKKKATKELNKQTKKKNVSIKEQQLGAEFRYINEKLTTTTSTESVDWFKRNPKYFEIMHKGFQVQAKQWPIIPVEKVIEWINSTFDEKSVIADMGCGEAKIAANVKHKVYSFDFKALSPNVIECDMSKTPLKDCECNVVVFVLSLMGTNLYDFIKEAKRILKVNGTLLIVEVSSRIEDNDEFIRSICEVGFKKKNVAELTNYFTWFEFTSLPCDAGLSSIKLKPVIYKRR